MALPQWQSLDEIIGGLSINFVSRLDQANVVPGLEDLKAGSPFLAIFQSVGQSRMRGQQQMMDVLDANDIDSPEADLDRIGAKEQIPRLGQDFGRGSVDIGDNSFVKVFAKLYHGSPAPIPGSVFLDVIDASSWPGSGKLYIGRGTTNFEGPLTFTAVANLGPNWRITLASGTTNFHALTEVVTLAQGGDRSVGAGQVVRTPAGGSTAPVNYATTQSVVVPDGETLLQNVAVTCQVPGSVGNVPKGSIKDVVAAAFTGMTVTNPQPISNGRDTELDDDYRARIKATRAARQKGTKTAIETFAVGATSPDENSTVTVAQLVKRTILPTILTIDDGSGYEEKTEGINYEVLVDSANGGETTFQLTYGRPVAKAAPVTILTAPYDIQANCVLAVEVGGIHVEHFFQTSDFRNVTNATAFEVVASINADANLSFSAHTVNGGSQVAIFAKQETQDDVRVVAPFAGVNANTFLGFPTGRYDTLRLYKNDRLLQKDGRAATIISQAQGSWTSMSSGETLIFTIDGVAVSTTINDVDFVNAGTGYISVAATNPLSAWAAVFNAKLPGITTVANGSFLELTSNRGKVASASIILDPSSTLVIKGMFAPTELSAAGRDFDYVLDRNLGQVELFIPLQAGDRLTAGTPFTRAYIESGSLASTTIIPVAGANFWFFVDGNAAEIPTGLNGAIYLSPATVGGDPTVTVTAKSTITFLPVNGVFSSLKVGDWYIQSFAAAPLGVAGAWRVSQVDPSGSWFKVEIPWATYTLTDSGATVFSYTTFVRAGSEPQRVTLTGGTFTPTQLAAMLAPPGTAATVVGSHVRVATNTFDTTGDIALMAQDAGGGLLQLPNGLVTNNEPHTASVESADGEVGTPNFLIQKASSLAGQTLTAGAPVLLYYREGLIDQLLFVRPSIVAPLTSRISTLDQVHMPVGAIASSTVFNTAVDPTILVTDAEFTNQSDQLMGASLFRFGPESSVNVALNDDPVGSGFEVAVYRRLIADPTVSYGGTLRLKDQDLLTAGNPSTLDKAFGTTFDFSNFVLHMRARGETHPADATKSILWRKSSYVGALASATVRYQVPIAAGQVARVTVDEPDSSISIYLPSGALRGVLPIPGQTLFYESAHSAVLSAYTISSITRVGTTVTATLTAPFSITPGTGMPNGLTIWVNIASANFSTGSKLITGTGVNTISWTETGSAVTETPAGAYASWAANPTDFSSVQVGDYSYGWLNYFSSSGAHLLSVIGSVQYGVDFASAAGFVQGLQTVATFGDFVFYPISQSTGGISSDLTATDLATLVSALPGTPITGTVIGTGAGIITQAYPDDANARAFLQDGILHILSSVWNGGAGNYDLTLKFNPVLSGLDYTNELFRLVPTTAKNVSDFLAVPSVTGLTLGGAELARADRAEHVQVATQTLGTLGAVQVTGGNANDLRLAVTGTATLVSGLLKIPVRTSADLSTLPTYCWVAIHGGQVVPKTLNWTALSTLQFFTAGSKVKVGVAGTAWANTATTVTGGRWYVERHGRFVGYTLQGPPGLVGLNAGDWVIMAGGTASLANLGRFRVLQTLGNTFWVDNADAVNEDVTINFARFYTYDSVMPGDTFQVGTAAFGAANQGLWTVSAIDDGIGNDPTVFYVTGVIINNGPTVVGANLAFVRVTPATPPDSFGLILNYIQDPNDPTVTNLYLNCIDALRPSLVSLPAQATVQALDRLEFPTALVTGQDGYTHDIGLIAAVNQVLYGDESDDDTYPGVISVGDDIFIGPPLIRRVFISVAVREVSNSNTTPGVQAAIAKVINTAGGKPVAISAYLTAAQAVPGVLSIVPLDPIPVTGADTIPVQPGESARVLDIDSDVQVSIIGQ